MRYLTFNAIAKRCPNGKWKDDETGQCIPIDEWKAKHHRNSPKEKTEADDTNAQQQDSADESNRVTDYGISEEGYKELEQFYDDVSRNPIERSKDALKKIDEALADDSISLDEVFESIGAKQYEGKSKKTSYSELKRIKDKGTRTEMLKGLKRIVNVCPFVTLSVPYVDVTSMHEEVFGETYTDSGYVRLSEELYTTEKSIESIKEVMKFTEYMNPNGEKDKISWNFLPSNLDEMSDKDMLRYYCKNTLTHELGHAIGGYLDSISNGREDVEKYFEGSHGKSFKQIFDDEYEGSIEQGRIDLEKRFSRMIEHGADISDKVIKKYLDKYESIVRKHWKFDMSSNDRIKLSNALDRLEDELESKYDQYVPVPYPYGIEYSKYDKSNGYSEHGLHYQQEKVIEECYEIYKELYGLTDETFNPFDCYSEYGYYASGGYTETDKPSKKASNSRTQVAERIAEAFADVCCRDEPNTMSRLIVSAVNYNIQKAIQGTDVSFKDYFFGDSMKEQREQMKNNRVIKSDDEVQYWNAISKKKCPEGYHVHIGFSKNCHPIDKPHKPGTKANAWHQAHGLVTAEGGKEEDKPKEKKPEEKKEEYEEDESDKPFTEGIPKAVSVKESKNISRKAIIESNSKLYKDYTSDIKKMRENLSNADWDNPKMSNAKMFKEIMSDYEERYGLDLKLPSSFSKIPKEVFKSQMENMVTIFEEYPLLVTRFNGFQACGRGALMRCTFDNAIQYHLPSFENSSMIDKDISYKINAKDPISKKDTEWFFHFDGSTRGNSVFHEFGHAFDNTLFALTQYVKGDYSESSFDDSTIKDLNESLSNIAERRNMKVVQGVEDRGEYLTMVFKGRMYMSSWNDIKTACENAGLVIDENLYGTGKRGECEIHILNPNKSDKKEATAKKFSDMNHEDFIKMNKVTSWNLKIDVKSDDFSVKRIRECEEMYKELYNLTEIEPSDVYSTYGYYGVSEGNSYARTGSTKRLEGTCAKERMAEAMEDVMHRKEKANSMSQLIVCHTQYEMYQIAMGDFDMTFKDYIKNKVGVEKFKERIVKMRYLCFR